MRQFFHPILVEETRQRILRLRPESERQWGSMAVAQTLAHCTAGIEMAMGVLQAKRARFPAALVGPLIKTLVFRDDKPLRRNSPSSPELLSGDLTQCELERERSVLIAAIDSFASHRAACCTGHPPPFFGRLKPEQWAILMYKHVDPHLRHFGV